MIEAYISDLARCMKIPLTDVSIVNVNPIAGSPDVHLLKMSSGERISTALLWQADLDTLQSGHHCDLLETKIRLALERLQIQDSTVGCFCDVLVKGKIDDCKGFKRKILLQKNNTQFHSTSVQKWRWCPRCEKAFMSLLNDKCRYRGCEGPDIRDWDDVRAENRSYPETPTLGHIYSHFSGRVSREYPAEHHK